jgi:hypothetical protein
VENLGIGKKARGVIAFAIVSKYAVVAYITLGEGAVPSCLLGQTAG